MDIDNLKEMWQQYDAELKRTNLVNEKLMKELLKDRSATKARNLSKYEYLSLAISGMLIVVFVAMWYRMRETPELLGFYLVDLALCTFAVCWNIYKLRLINRIDADGSIVETQGLVSRLKLLTVREKVWSILLMPLIICGMVPVLHNWIHGGSAFDFLSSYIPRFIVGYALAIVLTIWLYKRFLLRDIQTISDNLREIEALKKE